MDVSAILGELERIGAVVAPEAEVPQPTEEQAPTAVEAAPPAVDIAEPLRRIYAALDVIRENLQQIAPHVAAAVPLRLEPAQESAVAKPVRRRRMAKAEPAEVPVLPPVVSAPLPMPAPPPVPVIPGPPSLAEARARLLRGVRGEDLPARNSGDDERDVPYVGSDRAIPVDLTRAESVSRREVLSNLP